MPSLKEEVFLYISKVSLGASEKAILAHFLKFGIVATSEAINQLTKEGKIKKLTSNEQLEYHVKQARRLKSRVLSFISRNPQGVSREKIENHFPKTTQGNLWGAINRLLQQRRIKEFFHGGDVREKFYQAAECK